MNLKYERQWEVIEKQYDEFLKTSDYLPKNIWETKRLIINKIFKINEITYNKLWLSFEEYINFLHLYNWEYQQKPLLDKLIEVTLWNKEN